MMQWIIPAIILILAVWLVPMSVQSVKRSQKGKLGSVGASFMEGMATAHDPYKAMIVAEMEKRQNQDGEEADGDDEPLEDARP